MTNTAVFTTVFSCLLFCDGFLLGKTSPQFTSAINPPAASGATSPPGTVSPTNSYQYLEDVFIKERQLLQDYIMILEQRLNHKDQALEAKLNQTLDEISNITQILNSEKAQRVQLQKDYDKLIVDFYDLTVDHVALKAKNKELEVNNTKQNNKMILLNETLHNLTESVEQINVTAILSNHTGVLALKHKAGRQVGFSVDYPHQFGPHGEVKFSNVITNIGKLYNATSGEFTCDVPGLYFFTLVVYNTANAPVASCFITKNYANKVEAYLSIPPSGGYLEASASVVLHLSKGDKVALSGCTKYTLEWLTTFSGFLISAD